MTEETLAEEWARGSACCFGKKIHFFEVTDSTNRRALEALGQEDQEEGVVFIASRQTAGRGSGRNTWDSDLSTGLWFSLILRAPFRKDPLTFLPGVALARLLRREYGVEAHLKWPNDVLVDNRKICGILCESRVQPSGIPGAVMGVGVNVNRASFSGELADTGVSLRMITRREHSQELLFCRLMEEMETLYFSSASLVEEWKDLSHMIGRELVVSRQGRREKVMAMEINSRGELVVVHPGGEKEILFTRTGMDIL